MWGELWRISLEPSEQVVSIRAEGHSSHEVKEFIIKKDDVIKTLTSWGLIEKPKKQEAFTVMESCDADRPIGSCPRYTPGCCYEDCSEAPGHSCYGPNAPEHVDMFQPGEGMV